MKTRTFKLILAGIIAGILGISPTLRAASTGSEREPFNAPSQLQEATGEILSIDATAKSVTVKAVDTTTFKVTPTTQIVAKDNAKATLNDLKVGDNVTVTYRESGSAMVAQTIKVGEPAAGASTSRSSTLGSSY